MEKKNIFGLTLPEIETEFETLPKFRAKQIASWIYRRGAVSFEDKNLNKKISTAR